MSKDEITLEDLARMVASGFAAVHEELTAIRSDMKTIRRDVLSIHVAVDELDESLGSVEAFASDLRYAHEERLRELEARP